MQDKSTLLVGLVNKAPNQPLFTVQLKTPALLQQNLTRMLKTLPAQIPPECLIIQNIVRERLKRRGRGRL